ncbi:arsenate reductase ArsC [Methanoregula sp. PtaB.Bin085]|uniref:arsenate reductase ArsC n=1 Tax=Methanoregula sp. PtaB.Bin085 TaxID=1811680 RepID=UPI0009D13787|nr:arsenate reductase ArsC [Methanoregula sp. PtaB.Bin085]OPX64808.1 MAG: Protein ArsC [Methanoregula sp. PtaB.Bin085]
MKNKVLFNCTHNSARSQTGYMNVKFADRYEAFSAGPEKTRVRPMAVVVMRDIGIDISGHRSKLLDAFFDKGIETVVTVCDSAQGACPLFPGAKNVIHQSFPNPSRFKKSDEGVRAGFCHVRDAITQCIDATFGKTDA